MALNRYTKRDTILYASGWLQKEDPPSTASIRDEDIQAFMEVTAGLGSGSQLDLILHSPGGSLGATEAIVTYLRSRFSNIRVIVPNLAMSAAAMISCAADEIVMGKHSFLGPTDPQIQLPTPLGLQSLPAQAILKQFALAQSQSGDSARLTAWLPMLSQYGPALLVQCQEALDLSKELVQTWLEEYMFEDLPDAYNKALDTAEWLTNQDNFKSHGRHISRCDLEKRLCITHLEDDGQLQDLILSVFHATTHTFSGTPAVKIIENHLGRAFVKRQTSSPQRISS